MTRTDRIQQLLSALEARVLVIDGAMGTMIQRRASPRLTFAASVRLRMGTICAATTTCWCLPGLTCGDTTLSIWTQALTSLRPTPSTARASHSSTIGWRLWS